MSKQVNIQGFQVGQLSVIKNVGSNHRGNALWECLCVCGNITIVVGTELRNGHTTSCGCKRGNTISKLYTVNITGQRFNKLLAIKRVGVTKDGKATWECKCDCGNICIISGKALRNGHTKSCGCHKQYRDTELQKGNLSHRWKGGITPENEVIRQSAKYKYWRNEVFERDNFTCQVCKKRGAELQAHHIENYSSNHLKRFDENNGIALCIKCHKEFHLKYGSENNDMIQLIEFANIKLTA